MERRLTSLILKDRFIRSTSLFREAGPNILGNEMVLVLLPPYWMPPDFFHGNQSPQWCLAFSHQTCSPSITAICMRAQFTDLYHNDQITPWQWHWYLDFNIKNRNNLEEYLGFPITTITQKSSTTAFY